MSCSAVSVYHTESLKLITYFSGNIVCIIKGAVANGDYFFLNQHNFLITTGMTLFFIYLRMELNYLSNDIIICGFVVVVYTLYR